eukprot:TRINITY_DN21852_c0_g1_i2.p1 TRINITY_DN21852_c0_g1~~TRINITY_DN21852_c0_g1_i2.p1  ORF type:complete len:529 (+),score=96.02 TRINITY_DN21852_c0_g1_i2:270-1856(+)
MLSYSLGKSLEWDMTAFKHVAVVGQTLVCAYIWRQKDASKLDLSASVTLYPLCGQVLLHSCDLWTEGFFGGWFLHLTYLAPRLAIFISCWENTHDLLWLEIAMQCLLGVISLHRHTSWTLKLAAENESLNLLQAVFDATFVMDSNGIILNSSKDFDAIAACPMANSNISRLIVDAEDQLEHLLKGPVEKEAPPKKLRVLTLARDNDGLEFDAELVCLNSSGRKLFGLRVQSEKRQCLDNSSDADTEEDTNQMPLGAESKSFSASSTNKASMGSEQQQASMGSGQQQERTQLLGTLQVDLSGMVQAYSSMWPVLFKQTCLQGLELLEHVLPMDHERLMDALRKYGRGNCEDDSEKCWLRFAREADKTMFGISVEIAAGDEPETIKLTICGTCTELGKVHEYLRAQGHRSVTKGSSSLMSASQASAPVLPPIGEDEEATFESHQPETSWIFYFGKYLAKHILPRIPLGGHAHTLESACAKLHDLCELLQCRYASTLTDDFIPCNGFACATCTSLVLPEESRCFICGEAAE